MSVNEQFRLGIDIGGTFTDFTLFDPRTGKTISLKVPTVPNAPERGVSEGISILEREHGVHLGEVGHFVHGMTIGLNTLLQRAGSKCALLVTEGFRDILNLQRARLPIPYSFASFLPDPLIPRRFVYGIPERFDAEGNEVIPLDITALDEAVDDAVAHGAEAIAILFLHSYRTPAHELQAAARVRERHPQVKVSGSAEIWPEIREYERACATIANLYIQKNVRTYFQNLTRILSEKGLTATPFITQSNGGIMNLRSAAACPIKTLMSGPAAGVIGAIREARRAGFENVLTLDMGGTSTDISVIADGKPTFSSQSEIAGVPVVLPAIDIATVGAGGGSIGWVDQSGLLKVGPRSAGSDPGPACYGNSLIPTLTDAFLLCGFLNPVRFGGGRLPLDPDRSRQALEKLGETLGKSALETADAMVRVSVANMYAEISNNMEQRGYDPRELTIVAYGGGGPVAAAIVAEEIHAKNVLIPLHPGTLCAMGALSADFAYDAVAAQHIPLDENARSVIEGILDTLAEQAREWLARQNAESVCEGEARLEFFADARYCGQSYEIQIPLEAPRSQDGPPATQDAPEGTNADAESLDAEGLLSRKRIAEAFNEAHEHLYGHAERGAAIEIVNLRARITASTPPLPALDNPRGANAGSPVVGSRRSLRYGKRDFIAKAYDRESLQTGDTILGPAIIEQDDTTVLVIPGWIAKVDGLSNIIIERITEDPL